MPRFIHLALILAATFVRTSAATLVINQIAKDAQAIVYELPDAEGREDVVRFVELIRNKFRPGMEIIDAATLAEPALRQKLSKPFLLYTTLGDKSRLLRLTTQKLGWNLTASTFQWGAWETPREELRIIAAAKNPFAEGYCVVYAAQSNRLLAGINRVFHGPSSYYIFRNEELLKEGFYDESFRDRATLSSSEALQDIAQFFATLERVHPQLLAKVSKEDFARLQEDTRTAVTSKADTAGQVKSLDLVLALSRAAARFQDGHTSVRWRQVVNASNARSTLFPPFRLRFDNGRWRIAAATEQSLAGTEVLAVNEKPVLEFLAPILERCSGETQAFRAARFLGDEAFWFWLTRIVEQSELRLRVKTADGKDRSVSLKPIQFQAYEHLSKQQPGGAYRPNRSGTKVDFFDSGGIAYFQYPAFHRTDGEKKKIDAIFAEMRERKSTHLIIDLRGNGGGNSDMGDHIFTYLHGGKFRQFSRVEAKISDEVKQFLPRWARPVALFTTGRVMGKDMGEEKHAKPAAFFSGRKYLLIDNDTFSSATDFAAMFRDYQTGDILGYETGGVPTSFGDTYEFPLKNSQIPCRVSWKRFYPPKPKPGDDQRGVQPDIGWTDELLEPFRKEQDPGLAFTLEHVRRGK
ncbi:MAG: hypothetical protein HY820_02105 [Acidobacteria bacterium]|nr:hypothetical protein [Acidobacteriota bacterium]